MDVHTGGKLKNLLAVLPQHGVATSDLLRGLNISPTLVQEYVKNGWLTRIGHRAFRRPHDPVTWQSGLSALQHQLHNRVTLGGLTALTLGGSAHFLRVAGETIYLFSPTNATLPAWFKRYDWGAKVVHTQTKLFPEHLGIENRVVGGFDLKTSTPERAILECLHLAPTEIDLEECYQIMEGMFNLRPALIQTLLEQCNSIKVRRLFLFMAEKAKLPIFKHLDLSRIELGSGNRAIVHDGVYDPRYKITVPRGLMAHV
jgi:Transcriptional regulator, AbiEi antitoxin, Type IV TA system/Transcriptional regulator, AbiEi antitoxin N-terminal domain